MLPDSSFCSLRLLRIFTQLQCVRFRQGYLLVTSDKTGVSLTARAIWLLVAKILAFGLNVALPLLLVRRLTQAEFGLYKQVFLVVGTALALLPLGFQMSAFYFLPRERERQGEIVLNIVLFQLVMAGVGGLVLFLFPNLLATIFQGSDVASYGPSIAFVVFFWVLSSHLEVLSLAHEESRLSTIFIISSQLSKTLLLLLAATMFGSVAALIYAALIQGIIQTVILLLYLNSRFPRFWARFEWSVLRMQLSYSLPFAFAGLLYTLLTDLHHYFVSNRFDAATYALYAIGCFNIPLVGILSESIAAVMIPAVSRLQKQADHREILVLTARVMRKLSMVFLPLYAFLIVMGREFLTALFTPQYSASWPIFAINLTMLPLSIMVLDPIMRAYAEHRNFLPKLYSVLSILLALALWLGIGRFGLVAAIATVVVVHMIGRLATAIKVAYMLDVRWEDATLLKDVGKVAIAAAVAAIITALGRILLSDLSPLPSLAVGAAIFGVAFTGGTVLLNILTVEERQYVRRWVWRPLLRDTAEPLTRS